MKVICRGWRLPVSGQQLNYLLISFSLFQQHETRIRGYSRTVQLYHIGQAAASWLQIHRTTAHVNTLWCSSNELVSLGVAVRAANEYLSSKLVEYVLRNL